MSPCDLTLDPNGQKAKAFATCSPGARNARVEESGKGTQVIGRDITWSPNDPNVTRTSKTRLDMDGFQYKQ